MEQDRSELEEKMINESKIRSSPADVERLVETLLWKDFCDIMERRVEVLKSSLLNAESLEELREIRGEIRGIMFWRILPDTLINVAKHSQEPEKEENDG